MIGRINFGKKKAALAHSDLTDMPSATNSDHDGRYYTHSQVDTLIDTRVATTGDTMTGTLTINVGAGYYSVNSDGVIKCYNLQCDNDIIASGDISCDDIDCDRIDANTLTLTNPLDESYIDHVWNSDFTLNAVLTVSIINIGGSSADPFYCYGTYITTGGLLHMGNNIDMEGYDITEADDIHADFLVPRYASSDVGSSANRWDQIYCVDLHYSGALYNNHIVENIEVEKPIGPNKVLIWENGKLVPCYKENDPRVFGVSTLCKKKDENRHTIRRRFYYPAIIGIHPIRVIGPVKEGDLLVTSSKKGHAMVNNNPKVGTVIGQALESFDGDEGTILCMLRKM